MITPSLISAGLILLLAGALLVSLELPWHRADPRKDGRETPLPPEDPFGEDSEERDTKRPTHLDPLP
jgi:hypothetical protein